MRVKRRFVGWGNSGAMIPGRRVDAASAAPLNVSK